MTDNEIVKIAEHCAHWKCFEDCEKCYAFKIYQYDCGFHMAVLYLDLISRQKAEIEGLQERISYLEESIDCSRKEYNNLLQKLQQAKSEAIKEFAKRLKNKIWYNPACNHYRTITPDDIYDLARKMTEE